MGRKHSVHIEVESLDDVIAPLGEMASCMYTPVWDKTLALLSLLRTSDSLVSFPGRLHFQAKDEESKLTVLLSFTFSRWIRSDGSLLLRVCGEGQYVKRVWMMITDFGLDANPVYEEITSARCSPAKAYSCVLEGSYSDTPLIYQSRGNGDKSEDENNDWDDNDKDRDEIMAFAPWLRVVLTNQRKTANCAELLQFQPRCHTA